VGIGVEEPIVEHHLGGDVRGSFGERVPIHARGVERGGVGDLHPIDALQRDDPGRRGLPEHARDLYVGLVGEVAREPLGVTPLREVVQLGAELPRELLRDADHVHACRRLPPATGAGGAVLQDLEVLLHLLDRAGAADLDHDLGSVVQQRRVRLPDRGGREGVGPERGEGPVDAAAQLALHDLSDHGAGYGRACVLELGQLAAVLGPQQVASRGDDLADLDERRPELLQRQAELARRRVWLVSRRSSHHFA
jgi:hypothetical protein